MIAVDTNILCLRWLPATETSLADALLKRDPVWVTALLWRWEFRNALTGYVRRGSLTKGVAIELCGKADESMAEREFSAPPRDIFDLVSKSNCSAHDCEFVAIARNQGLRLITANRQVLREFPHVAVPLSEFLAS